MAEENRKPWHRRDNESSKAFHVGEQVVSDLQYQLFIGDCRQVLKEVMPIKQRP